MLHPQDLFHNSKFKLLPPPSPISPIFSIPQPLPLAITSLFSVYIRAFFFFKFSFSLSLHIYVFNTSKTNKSPGLLNTNKVCILNEKFIFFFVPKFLKYYNNIRQVIEELIANIAKFSVK